jgi:hypothetical protein
MWKYNYTPFHRPAIDPKFSIARELVLQRLAKYDGFLDVVSPEEWVIYEIGLDIFKDMEKQEYSITFVHALMQNHWQISETDDAWNSLVLHALGKAMDDLWRARYARKEAEEARRKAEQITREQEAEQRRAEEEAEKNEKKAHAALARQISKEFGVTLRQARTLRDEGTSNPERAQRLAEISGRDASTFLRKDHRKRNADLVRLFMAVDHQHVTFTHFVHDADKVISNEALRVFLDENKSKFHPGEDFKSLQRMIERLSELGCPLTLESATTLWREYTVWRINTISGMARYDVEFE